VSSATAASNVTMPAPAPTPEPPSALVLPVFGSIEPERLIGHDSRFAVVRDRFPVSPGHTLVIARRAVARFRDLTPEERDHLMRWLEWTRHALQETLQPKPDAFNFGLNDGPAAGQTVAQLHYHVIPRYRGDVPDPRGGVRWILPAKARYW
jgi:diadenosine tetraphosphate (Ap4A) HIT family hydrolase